MDILFVNPTDEASLCSESNGTMILATKLLDAGYSVDILRFYQTTNYNKDYNSFIEEISSMIIEKNPKCVSFYTLWPFYHILLRIAKTVKEKSNNIIVIFGGPQASATAVPTIKNMPFIDYISTGEGENTIVPFFDSIIKNNAKDILDVAGVFCRKDGQVVSNNTLIPLCNLNETPYWNEKLYSGIENYKYGKDNMRYYMPIDAGRGCPYSCTFCCTSGFWRRTYRLKSAERIVADIKYYHDKFGIKSFWFSHDAFTTDKALVSEVCDKILENNLNIVWKCTARVDCLSEELILKMKKAGMVQIEMGIETGSKRMQRIVNKNLRLEKAVSTIKFLIEQKIGVGLFFMYGLPEEEPEDLAETLSLFFDLIDLGVKIASMSFCRFCADTDITNRYFEQLVMDDTLEINKRGIYGYEEEFEVIKNNKEIFPHFYHYNTEVRNNYQFVYYLASIYQMFPNSARHLNTLYKGRALELYNDLIDANKDFFLQSMAKLHSEYREKAFDLFKNLVEKHVNSNVKNQVLALLEYDRDLKDISKFGPDKVLQKEYNFSYIDFSLKLPIEQYNPNGKTEMMLLRNDGKYSVKVLNVKQ